MTTGTIQRKRKTRKFGKGRAAGSRNKGYFHRSGRCWCASEGNRAVPLRYEDGTPIREKDASEAEVKAAYARYLLGKQQASPTPVATDQVTVKQACEEYLKHCKANNKPATVAIRAAALYDFCTGLPARFRSKTPSAKEIAEHRIHAGFGEMLVRDLLPLHVHRWLDSHAEWQGSRRTQIQSLKRALNYCVEVGLLEQSPLRGFKTPKANMRRTYITPEQENAVYQHAKTALATAIKVCIRTGARHGCEFAKLTSKHVHMHANGMEWRFSPQESKTSKARIIRIADPEIIAIVKLQMAKYPEGELFRNTAGKPWTAVSLRQSFARLRERLKKAGIELDKDACMYSCRHTFAKRTLQGYWTGKPTNIETLSKLMGNSREVCWEHYADWCDTYTDPLWDAVSSAPNGGIVAA